jgi:hypothetical protein
MACTGRTRGIDQRLNADQQVGMGQRRWAGERRSGLAVAAAFRHGSGRLGCLGGFTWSWRRLVRAAMTAFGFGFLLFLRRRRIARTEVDQAAQGRRTSHRKAAQGHQNIPDETAHAPSFWAGCAGESRPAFSPDWPKALARWLPRREDRQCCWSYCCRFDETQPCQST